MRIIPLMSLLTEQQTILKTLWHLQVCSIVNQHHFKLPCAKIENSLYFALDEYHTEFRRTDLSTFSPTNIIKLKNSNNPTHENDFVSLATESEPHVLDYCIEQKRPQLFTRSIDRRAILRNNQMLGYPSDPGLPKRLRNNHYSPNEKMCNRSFDGVQYNTSSNPSCEATLSRSYLASRSRGYQSGQPFSMQLALEHSPNHPSVFRNKRSREETWLV